MKDLNGLSYEDYLRIFWRRRWYFLGTWFLVTAGAILFAWSLPHIYISQAKIMVEYSVSEDVVRPIVRASAEDQVLSIREQLKSRNFLERVIEEFKLYDYGQKGFLMENAVEELRKHIQTVSESRGTLTVSFSSTDPHLSQQIVQRLINGLFQVSVASRQTKAIVTDQFLDEQIQQVQRELSDQERKIRAFKSAHFGELPDQVGTNMNAINALQGQLATAESALQRALDQRKLLEFQAQERGRLGVLSRAISPAPRLATQTAPRPPSALETQLAARRTQFAELNAKYTPNHPDIIRITREIQDLETRVKLAAQLQNTDIAGAASSGSGEPAVPSSVANNAEPDLAPPADTAEIQAERERNNEEVARCQKKRDEIVGQIRMYQGRLNMAPTMEQDYLALSRDHENLKQRYASLQNQKFQSEMVTSVETDRKKDPFKIVDQPNYPEKPASPYRTQIALMGCGAGLLLGLGAAFGREYWDPTLGTEQEAVATLRLPVLVSILEISPEGMGRKGERKTKALTA